MTIETTTMGTLNKEEENYLRVHRTLSIEGLAVIKDLLLEEIGGATNVQATLRWSKDKIVALTESQVLTKAQVEVLYGQQENSDLNEVDVVTMCQLLKTVSTNNPVGLNWEKKPKAHEIDKLHDVVRMKLIAEELNKRKNRKLLRIEFDYYWRELNRILTRLGVNQKLLKLYEIENLDRKQYDKHRDEIEKIINPAQIASVVPSSRRGSCCKCCLILVAAVVGLFAYLVATFSVKSGYGSIDYSKCTTLTAGWGRHIHCPDGHVVTGSCGAGEDGDCPGGTFLHLRCCPVINYLDDPKCDRTKLKFSTFYHDHKSCPGTSLLTGGCASGKAADCEGNFNTLYCQKDCRLTVNTTSCSWSGAHWGQYIACEPNQVLTGRCGAGRDADCSLNGKHYWMLIKCCDLIQIERSAYTQVMMKIQKKLMSELTIEG